MQQIITLFRYSTLLAEKSALIGVHNLPYDFWDVRQIILMSTLT